MFVKDTKSSYFLYYVLPAFKITDYGTTRIIRNEH